MVVSFKWNYSVRGGGRSHKRKRHLGYRPQNECGSQKRGAAPRATKGRAGGRCWRGSPLPQREIFKLQMRNPVFWCIFSPVSRDLHPWMEAMRSLRVRRDRENYLEKLGSVADWSPQETEHFYVFSIYTLYTPIICRFSYCH